MENIGLQDSLLSRFDLLFIMLDKVGPFRLAAVVKQTRTLLQVSAKHLEMGLHCRNSLLQHHKRQSVISVLHQAFTLKLCPAVLLHKVLQYVMADLISINLEEPKHSDY